MLIYADTDVCQYHLEQIDQDFTREFVNPDVAVFHIPFPWQGYSQDFQQRVDRALDICHQVVILCSELHNATVDFIQRYDHDKIVYFLNGHLNRRLSHAKVYQWFDWYHRTADFYKKNPQLLTKLTPHAVKPKAFDILLGQPRTHRDLIYKYIESAGLTDSVVMTYLRDFSQGLYDHDFHAKSFQERSNNEWLWELDGVEIPDDQLHFTIDKVKYHGQDISLSQIIPTSIYNQTAYSIVAETNYMNHYSFPTEKIVKPMLAERLFIAVSGQHYLRNLHSQGFQTFSDVIDESYDEEPDVLKRHSMINEQISYLIKHPQEDVLARIQFVTAHNKRVMLETDWYGDFSRVFRSLLLEHVGQN